MKTLLIPICFVLCYSLSFGQSPTIKNLVFEGAGIRGIAYAGAIQSLENHQLTKTIEKVGGTSAGAITSLLFALGYSSSEMSEIISNTEFQKFNDGKFFFIGGINRTKNNYGWYLGHEFTEWIGSLIKTKAGNSDVTFEDLHNKNYKDLYITATCLNQQKLIVLSYETYPKMKVKDAVRISMSIPLYFQAVFVDSVGNTYYEQNKDNTLDLMVDGGIIGNFPIQLFDKVKTDSLGNSTRTANFETIGIRIDSDMQIAADSTSKELAAYPIENFSDYITSFYTIVIENLNRASLTDDDWSRTISVSSVGIGPKIKKLSAEQKESLINSGFKSAERYLNK